MSVTFFEKPCFRNWKLKELQFLKALWTPLRSLSFPNSVCLLTFLLMTLLYILTATLFSSLNAWDLLACSNCIKMIFEIFFIGIILHVWKRNSSKVAGGKQLVWPCKALGLNLWVSLFFFEWTSVDAQSFSTTAQEFPVCMELFLIVLESCV